MSCDRHLSLEYLTTYANLTPFFCILLSRLVYFGHPPEGVLEGSLYTRRFLYSSNAHRADQKGVNGSIVNGCDSIVVSRQSADCREEDGLQWLRYTSNRKQGEFVGFSLLIIIHLVIHHVLFCVRYES